KQHKLVAAAVIVGERRTTVALGRIADVEADAFVLGKHREIEIAEMNARVVAVSAGHGIGRTVERRRTEDPVGIGESVQKAKVLEAAIGRLEAIPFRLFDADAKIALRIGAPAG